MKILILSHFLPYPPHGGALQRNHYLFREAAATNEVHLLSFTQRNILNTEAKLSEAVAECDKTYKSVTVFKIPTDYSRFRWYLLLLFNLLSLTPYSVWRFRTGQMARKLRVMIAEGNFDLVHIDTIALAGYIKYLGRVPAVLNHHNIESSLMLRRGYSEKNPLVKLYILLQGWKLRRYERLLAPRFALNLTVSELDALELLRFCPGAKTEVVPNGTNVEYFRPRPDEQATSMVWVGGMNWYPNRDAMTWFCEELFPRIRARVPQATAVIVGQDPAKRVLELAAHDPTIKVMGYVDDIREHVARAAVFVVPIRVGGGTRLKILDAFASGKAVVSTTIGAEGIGATNGTEILIGDSVEQFVDQAVRALTDISLRRKLESNARQFVERNYAWGIIGETLKQCYQNAAKV
ncbi:MAG: glycosyltransferase family 4 protein [Candidatus Zixiibacteriota bacterium]